MCTAPRRQRTTTIAVLPGSDTCACASRISDSATHDDTFISVTAITTARTRTRQMRLPFDPGTVLDGAETGAFFGDGDVTGGEDAEAGAGFPGRSCDSQ